MIKKGANWQKDVKAFTPGTLVTLRDSIEFINYPEMHLVGARGVVIDFCPNPWYNTVLVEGRVLNLFVGDLKPLEERCPNDCTG